MPHGGGEAAERTLFFFLFFVVDYDDKEGDGERGEIYNAGGPGGGEKYVLV